jgi:hypothetical protein
MSEDRHPARVPLFAFGSFSSGWVIGIVLHELGHAVAMWMMGGSVERITINPLGWSYTYYATTPKYPNFATWSGVLFGSLFGLMILASIGKRPGPYVGPLFIAGVSPMLNGGAYYLIDAFVSRKGDAASLILSGVPRYLVLGAGVLFLGIGVYLVLRHIHWIGIRPRDSWARRMAILGSGVLPYFVLSLAYAIVWEPEDTLSGVVSVAMAGLFAGLISFASIRCPRFEKNRLSTGIKTRHVVYAVVLGVSTIGVPYVLFSS